MEAFRFLNWQVYNEAQEILTDILQVSKSLPKEYRFEIGSQMNRAALSIVLNIAEGSGKNGDKDFGRYVDIALGSAYEVLACLDVLQRNTLITKDSFLNHQKRLASLCRQLGGFLKKLSGGTRAKAV